MAKSLQMEAGRHGAIDSFDRGSAELQVLHQCRGQNANTVTISMKDG